MTAAGRVDQWLKLYGESEPDDVQSDGYYILAQCPPERSILANIPRSPKLVDRRLIETFAGLALGELRWPLLITGEAGAGKTRAALCFADSVHSASYHTSERVADLIMRDGFPDLSADIDHPTLVILDEVGERSKASDLAYQAVKRMLDECEKYNRNVLVVISNNSPGELANIYDDRIASRLVAGTVFHLDAKDRRQER